jgi:protein SCO1/2
MKRPVIVWLLSVLALVALMVYVGPTLFKVVPDSNPTVSGQAAIGGDFTLTDGTGKTVTASDFRGKYTLVYFGFTRCPDICPTTLLTMMGVLEQLGDDGKNIVPVFITLDPERDTPKVVQTYVRNFSDRLVGLTGTMAQITQVAHAYKVYFSKVRDDKSAAGYVIDHSGFMYLMGPDGSYLAHFTHNMPMQTLASAIRKHVR